MKKYALILLCLASLLTASAQRGRNRLYSVAFYNLENLFDTIHDVGKQDQEFLLDGKYQWTARKYEAKIDHMARVLGELSREEVPQGPAFVGVAEVENHHVLDDLLAQPALAQYRYIHYEGPDKRGIDCALLYDPKQFKVKRSLLVPSIPFEGDTVHLTRGFLIVTGKLARERVAVIVNHWPSRGAKSPVRVHAARQVKALKDSLLRTNPKLKLIVMGDLNDDPMDESLQMLGARKQMAEVQPGEFYNPWWQVLEDEKQGTLLYKGAWNLFDQILLSSTLLSEGKRLRYDHHAIFRAPYLFEQEGKYKGTILRTHAGRKWLNGYSDHLPTIVYLRRGK